MKIKFKTGLIFIVILISVFVCITYKQMQLSPEDVVTLYFTYFNDKNEEQMKLLEIESNRGWTRPWEHQEYVNLLSCYEGRVSDKDYVNVRNNINPEAAYVAKVYVAFDIKFENDALPTGGMESGIQRWTFYLIKDSKNAPWQIASIGH